MPRNTLWQSSYAQRIRVLIYSYPNPVRSYKLARELGTTTSALGGKLFDLCKGGFAVRVERGLYALTEKGIRFVEEGYTDENSRRSV